MNGPNIKWRLQSSIRGKCINLLLILSSLPKQVTKIIAFYKIHLKETGIMISGIKAFKKVNDKLSKSCIIKELKEESTSIKKLEFECSMNILRIEADENIFFEYPLNVDLKTNRRFICDWKIKDEKLDKLKASNSRLVLTSLADDIIYHNMWKLECCSNDTITMLFLKLYALPIGIKYFRLKLQFSCLEIQIDPQGKSHMPWNWGYPRDWGDEIQCLGSNALLLRDITDLEEINFRVIITVIGFETVDDEYIELPPYAETDVVVKSMID